MFASSSPYARHLDSDGAKINLSKRRERERARENGSSEMSSGPRLCSLTRLAASLQSERPLADLYGSHALTVPMSLLLRLPGPSRC